MLKPLVQPEKFFLSILWNLSIPWIEKWLNEFQSWHRTECWYWQQEVCPWRSAPRGTAWSRSRSRGRSERQNLPSSWQLPRRDSRECLADSWVLVLAMTERYCTVVSLSGIVTVILLTALTWNTAMSSKNGLKDNLNISAAGTLNMRERWGVGPGRLRVCTCTLSASSAGPVSASSWSI